MNALIRDRDTVLGTHRLVDRVCSCGPLSMDEDRELGGASRHVVVRLWSDFWNPAGFMTFVHPRSPVVAGGRAHVRIPTSERRRPRGDAAVPTWKACGFRRQGEAADDHRLLGRIDR